MFVMQIVRVGIRIHQAFFSHFQFIKSDVTDDCSGACYLQVVEKQYGMRWQDKMNETIRPIEQVFNRVHGQG